MENNETPKGRNPVPRDNVHADRPRSRFHPDNLFHLKRARTRMQMSSRQKTRASRAKYGPCREKRRPWNRSSYRDTQTTGNVTHTTITLLAKCNRRKEKKKRKKKKNNFHVTNNHARTNNNLKKKMNESMSTCNQNVHTFTFQVRMRHYDR